MIDNKFIVIVPTYNAEPYIEKCLESILTQDYKNYELVVIDDGSSDKSYEIISRIHNKYQNFTAIKNDERIGSPLHNIVKGSKLCGKNGENILVTVDGDDWLSNSSVLEYLNKVYKDENVYLTYGQYEPLSRTYFNYCQPIPNTRTYRRSKWWTSSHLRTYKCKLFAQIKDSDLRDKNGEYYKAAGDLALMYPMIEICGRKHIKWISDVLYIYNDLNPIAERNVWADEQLRVTNEIQSKPLYDELIDKL